MFSKKETSFEIVERKKKTIWGSDCLGFKSWFYSMLVTCHWVGCFPSESRFPYLPNENDDKTAVEECLSGRLNARTTRCWNYSREIDYVIVCFINHDVVMMEETTACCSERHVGMDGEMGWAVPKWCWEVWAALRPMVHVSGCSEDAGVSLSCTVGIGLNSLRRFPNSGTNWNHPRKWSFF